MINTTALIIARGGSKSVPRKNLRLIAGKPLISHTFKIALECRAFKRIIISTDSSQIAALARKSKIEVPFMRPPELALDTSTTYDTAAHAISWLKKNEQYETEYMMLLQPTSPLRTKHDILKVMAIAEKDNADAVVSVSASEHHPCLSKSISKNGVLAPFIKTDKSESRRQDLPPAYCLNGSIYLVKTSVLMKEKSWCPKKAIAYIMPPERSIDIDTEWDMKLTSLILENMSNNT